MISFADWVYLLPMLLCSPCLLLGAIAVPKVRRQLKQIFFQLPDPLTKTDKPRLWIHGASVGETQLGLQLVKLLRTKNPEFEVVFTANRDTALDLVRAQGHPAFIRPFDFSFLVNLLLKRLKPDLLVLVETELWPNLIRQSAKKIPVILINGRLSDKHAQNYRRFCFFYGPMIRQLTGLFANNQESRERFEALGGQVRGQGDLKLGLTEPPDLVAVENLKKRCGLGPKDFVLVLGSLQPEELTLLARPLKQLKEQRPNLRVILVPRHPEKSPAFLDQAQKAGFSTQRDSEQAWSGSDLYLIDRIGVLTLLYSLANLAFVGGSFCDRGGQNMVEPVGLGVPTAVGPDTRNFTESVKLLSEAGGLAVLQTPADLVILASNSTYLKEMADKGRACLQEQQNHWTQIVEVLDEKLFIRS